jgi:type II secretory ATPase GspE/PulE/Tfp pilus assembly ATPase PilB-like protein
MDVCLDIARTGHFLLSSFHTPDCEETLRYLQELSSDSMVLSTVIVGIVCQRLLRKVCPHCSRLEKLGAAAADLPGVDSSCEVPVACGCEHCNDTGYRGRIAVYEFFTPDRVKRGLIREKNEKKLNKFFKSEEFEGLKQKAIKEMLAGKTTLEEIQWVFPEDFSC